MEFSKLCAANPCALFVVIFQDITKETSAAGNANWLILLQISGKCFQNFRIVRQEIQKQGQPFKSIAGKGKTSMGLLSGMRKAGRSRSVRS